MADANAPEEATPAHDRAHAERRRRLGRAIRTLRGDRSQSDLGDDLGGTPQTTISRWELGLVDLNYEQVFRVEKALQVKQGTLGSLAGYIDPVITGSPAPTLRTASLPTILTYHADKVLESLSAAAILGLGVQLSNQMDGDEVAWFIELSPEPENLDEEELDDDESEME